MSRVSILSLAGATALFSTAAFAADLSVPPPIMPAPIVESGWYLRGDIGMSNQRFTGLSYPGFSTAPQFAWYDAGGFDSAPFFLIGLGYQWNSWLRFDVTGEYRGGANFHALDHFDNSGTLNTNQYTATKSEMVVLGNAYVDLGTWWCVTPFIGAGVGFTRNQIDHFRDVNVIAGGGGWADSGSTWGLAWALTAGASYKVTQAFSVELAYRYLSLGNAKTGTLLNLDPTAGSGTVAPVTFNNIYSHDLMLGIRWNLQPEPVYQPPLIRKG